LLTGQTAQLLFYLAIILVRFLVSHGHKPMGKSRD